MQSYRNTPHGTSRSATGLLLYTELVHVTPAVYGCTHTTQKHSACGINMVYCPMLCIQYAYSSPQWTNGVIMLCLLILLQFHGHSINTHTYIHTTIHSRNCPNWVTPLDCVISSTDPGMMWVAWRLLGPNQACTPSHA